MSNRDERGKIGGLILLLFYKLGGEGGNLKSVPDILSETGYRGKDDILYQIYILYCIAGR